MPQFRRSILAALPLILASPLAAQATAPSAAQNAPSPIDRSAPAPKPTPAQWEAFRAALEACRSRGGESLPATKNAEMNDLITESIATIDAARVAPPSPDFTNDIPITRDQKRALLGAVGAVLLANLPHAAKNYDKLTPEEQAALTARTGMRRIDMNDLCPFNPAGFPVLRWLADDEQMSRTTRSTVNGILGLLALEGIQENAGDVIDPAETRAYFLKSFLFSAATPDLPFAKPDFWSDGVDNDLFGNFERQGLQAYFDRAMAGAHGHLIRTLHDDMLARSNPDKMRTLLMSEADQHGGFYDALLLLQLERKGLISPRYTEADRAYWQKIYDDLTPEMKRLHGPKLLPRIAITKAETAKAQVKSGQ